jgi:hypothetical protein
MKKILKEYNIKTLFLLFRNLIMFYLFSKWRNKINRKDPLLKYYNIRIPSSNSYYSYNNKFNNIYEFNNINFNFIFSLYLFNAKFFCIILKLLQIIIHILFKSENTFF